MNKFKNYMNNLLVFYADYFEHVNTKRTTL